MNRFATRLISTLAVLLLFGGTAAAGEAPRLRLSDAMNALDIEFQVPAAWAGVWEVTDVERDCETLELVETTTGNDTLCAGDLIDLTDDGTFEIDCNGTVTDTHVDIECTGSSEEAGCTGTFSLDLEADRDGETFSGTSITSLEFTGEGCGPFVFGFCQRIETTATRIGPQPAECAVPVETVSWSTLKARYD